MVGDQIYSCYAPLRFQVSGFEIPLLIGNEGFDLKQKFGLAGWELKLEFKAINKVTVCVNVNS
ncbi:MAG: hypothetical protein ACI8XV_002864 [Arenicella sp.]